jgi:hypothetical protein
MAKASRKHFGPGVQGKGDGTGAMTELEDEAVEKDRILSNRDKAAHGERGQDGAWIQAEERKDTAGNRRIDPDALDVETHRDDPEDDPGAG